MGFLAAIKPMPRQITKFLLLALALAFTIKSKAADRWETLRAINWVENPTNQTRVGRYGELGPYQFKPSTWRMHTDKPFRLAIRRAEADEIAVRHYEWIKHQLEQAGVEPSPFNIALAWNCGVGSVVSGRAPSVSFDYASRVTNLVESFRERPLMLAEAAPTAAPTAAPKPNLSDPEWALPHFRVLQTAPRFVIADN